MPKIKISENAFKITNPGYKKVARLYDRDTEKAIADLIMLEHETIDESKPLTIFDPINTWKRMTLTNFKARELLVPIFRNGRRVYELPSLMEIQNTVKKWAPMGRIQTQQNPMFTRLICLMRCII